MERNELLTKQKTKLLEDQAREIRRLKEEQARLRSKEISQLAREREEDELARLRRLNDERLEAESHLRAQVRAETEMVRSWLLRCPLLNRPL